MTEHIAELTALIAIFALIGPALLYLGMRLGRHSEAIRRQDGRMDKLEETLSRQFKQLHEELTRSLEKAWLNCPLALKKDHPTAPNE